MPTLELGNVNLLTTGFAISLGRAAVVLGVACVAVPLLQRAVCKLGGERLRPQQQMLLRRLVAWLGYGLTGSWALAELGFDVGVLLGAAGVFTVAVGFAAQTSVSNLISGLFLILEQPFSVADQIIVNGVTGEILSIDLLSVKMRTGDNLFVRMPNEMLLKGTVVNLTRYNEGVGNVLFAVGLGQPLEPILKLLLETASKVPACMTQPPPNVDVLSYQNGAAQLQLTFWAPRAQLNRVKTQLQMLALAAFARENIALPPLQRVS